MTNTIRNIALQIAITLTLAAAAGAALYSFADYATQGVVV